MSKRHPLDTFYNGFMAGIILVNIVLLIARLI